MAKTTTDSKTNDKSTQTSPMAPNTVLPLTLKWQEVEPIYKKVMTKMATRVKLPGFRQGKVPTTLAADAIGQQKIIEATLDQVLPAKYREVLEKSGKQPLTQPDIKPVSLEIGKDWELEVQLAERPTIKLGDFQKTVKDAKKEAETEIKKMVEEQKKLAKKTAEEHKGHNHPIAPPKEMTDKDKEDVVLRFIFGKLVTEINPQIPELLVRQETRHDLEHLLQTLDQLKIKFDDYLARRNYTFEQLSQEMAATALSKLQIEFILSEIGKAQKLDADKVDIDKHFADIQDEKIRKRQQANPDYTRYVAGIITRQKTLDYLLNL